MKSLSVYEIDSVYGGGCACNFNTERAVPGGVEGIKDQDLCRLFCCDKIGASGYIWMTDSEERQFKVNLERGILSDVSWINAHKHFCAASCCQIL